MIDFPITITQDQLEDSFKFIGWICPDCHAPAKPVATYDSGDMTVTVYGLRPSGEWWYTADRSGVCGTCGTVLIPRPNTLTYVEEIHPFTRRAYENVKRQLLRCMNKGDDDGTESGQG